MAALSAGLGTSFLVVPGAVATTTAATGLHVVGNVIDDGQGRPFFVHGVDRPSLEWSCTGQAVNGQAGIPAGDFTTMAGVWGANTVRVDLNQDFWLSSTGSAVNSRWQCPNYVATVRQVVANATAAGLNVILDLHWSDEGNLTNPNVGQQCMADNNSLTFWRQVAQDFGGNSSVLFELYNEPHNVPWPVWRNGGSFTCSDGHTYHAAGMQQLMGVIRATGASNIVVAGGENYAYDLSGVATYALTGTNVAYATHPYEFKSGDSPVAWDAAFGFLTTKAPVVATEFGTNVCGTDAYDSDILRYFQSHGMGYTAWGWWAGGCSFPALISGASGACVNGGCVTQHDLLAYSDGSRSVSVPATAAPGPTGPSIRFNFEDKSAEGWAVMWGSTLSASPTTAEAWAGNVSLGMAVTGTGYPGMATTSGLAGLSPGMTVTYHVWAPTGAKVSVAPFAFDGAWHNHALASRALSPGWNTLTWVLPAMSGLKAIGLQVDDSSGWAGNLALDAVSW